MNLYLIESHKTAHYVAADSPAAAIGLFLNKYKTHDILNMKRISATLLVKEDK